MLSARDSSDILVKAKSEVSLVCCTTSQSVSLEISGGTLTNTNAQISAAPANSARTPENKEKATIKRSRSLEAFTCGAMWSSLVDEIVLTKSEKGLGFSILDYQDPENANATVIVVRSLIPGGMAQQDGRIVPGDRLVYVNDVRLDNASLDSAVQALKGAAFGPVKLGIARPIGEERPQLASEEASSSVSDLKTDPVSLSLS